MRQAADLEELARRYVWWKPPAESAANLGHLLCQVMQLGTQEDIAAARALVGDDAFRTALRAATPGLLDERSWNFWHRFWFHEAPPVMPERLLP
ncbi:MAG TPA: hypothetical protein VH143_13395 [Kofleriaceae bacterium]|nr:hypothetical protein [Kofleriaceae bacterium]